MSTPKIIAVVFLSLFLIIALFLFGFLFTMKMTALSTGYVSSSIDSLPLSSLVEEIEFDEALTDNPELVNLIKNVVAENEAVLKERTGETIDTIYKYLNGKSRELDMALVLKDTILDPAFTISIIQKADLAPLVKELVSEMTKEADLPYGLSIEPHIDDITNDLEPWLKEQTSAIIPPIYDYVLGFSQNMDIVIQMEKARETIGSYLKQDFLNSPPPQFAGLPTTELGQKFDEAFAESAGDIWTAIEIDTELLNSNIQADVAKSLAEAEEALSVSRQYIGYFNAVYALLIVFIVLLIIGIILIYREVKGASRILGGIFLSYGIVNLTAVLIARGTIERQMMVHLDDMPESTQTWLLQLATGSLTPLLILAIVLLLIGVFLLTTSFIYKRNQPQTGTFE